MGVENRKSTVVTALDNSTPTAVESILKRGEVFVDSGKAAIAAADDDGSVYRLVRLPSSVRILGIRRRHAAVTSGTDFDIGCYRTAADGGTVVDKDSLVDGQSLASAVGFPTETLGANLTIDTEKRLWQLQSGVTVDPGCDYDICLTGNTVGSAAVDVYFDIFWTY